MIDSSESSTATPIAEDVPYAIELESVTKRFGARTAVDDLSLRVPSGSLLGFIGLNGAGKSTTIRMAVGLLAPTSGSIRVAGCDVRDRSQRVELLTRIGYVPDRPTVYGWMRVGQAIAFTRRFYVKWDQTMCDDLVTRLRLPMDGRLDKLSKGQAAKLQLLLAVCHRPRVLILDEPTSGFDPVVREDFIESILRISGERGQTILLSSHALADVQRLADRVAVMHEGRLVMHGTVDELLGRVKRVRAVLDDATQTVQAPTANVLRSTRAGREWTLTLDRFSRDQLDVLRSQNPTAALDVVDLSLDDIFKDLVRGRKEASSSAR